jgi:hypothetical protein
MIGKLLQTALILSASATLHAQEFRDTAVPNAQIAAVTRDVAQWHDMQNPDCRFVRAVGSKLVERTSEHSVEHWTISACSDKQFTYEVTVLDTSGGGVSNMVANVDGSAFRSGNESPMPDPEECAEMQSQFDALRADDSADKDYSKLAELAANLAVCNAPAAP